MKYLLQLSRMLRALILAVIALSFTAATTVKVVDLKGLRAIAEAKQNDTLYVVNFWATWCKPCVAEMPYFVKADEKFAAQKVKVVFVSLNSAKEQTGVQQFLTGKQITQQAVILSAGNPNQWIDSVDASWGGSIPATAMYKGGKKVFFYEGELTQTELDSIIQTKNK